MKQPLYEYKITTPEVYAGEVMGELTVLDVAVENVEVKDGIWVINARSNNDITNKFRSWLLELTNNAGTIEARGLT